MTKFTWNKTSQTTTLSGVPPCDIIMVKLKAFSCYFEDFKENVVWDIKEYFHRIYVVMVVGGGLQNATKILEKVDATQRCITNFFSHQTGVCTDTVHSTRK